MQNKDVLKKSVHAIIQKVSGPKKDKWPIKMPNFGIHFSFLKKTKILKQ